MNELSRNAIEVQQCAAHLAAVFKTGSFSRAAEALGIQQSAVSHRIRKLESQLGYRLFERSTRSLRVTDAGRQLSEVAVNNMSQIADVLRRIEETRASTALRLSATVSLTSKWLIHRLRPANSLQPRSTSSTWRAKGPP